MPGEVVLAGVDNEVKALQRCQGEDVWIVVLLGGMIAAILAFVGDFSHPRLFVIWSVFSLHFADPISILLQSVAGPIFSQASITTANTTIIVPQQPQEKLQQGPQMCMK